METPESWRWREGPIAPGPTVVFDMDGVLSNASDRQHHIANRDWNAVLLTARPLRVQPQTLEWLARHDLRWDLLCMREDRSGQEAWEFKKRTVGELREFGLDLKLAFEDDRKNADMFHGEGIPCVYIHSGYYE